MSHNTTNLVTLFLLSGYSTQLTPAYFAESSEMAVANVAQFATSPDHITLEAWLEISSDNSHSIHALAYMHAYWNSAFNCGPSVPGAVNNMVAAHRRPLRELVAAISSQP